MHTSSFISIRSRNAQRLLGSTISELGLRFRESHLVKFQNRLLEELAGRGIKCLSPTIYFGDEWYTPDHTIAISVPLYLANATLLALARQCRVEIEGASAVSFMRLLRHECGHAFDHAYRLSKRKDWQRIFGHPSAEYSPDRIVDPYDPQRFVRNLARGYAQTHPFEDFAETFAVWLKNHPAQLEHYRRFPIIQEKLRYIDNLVKEVGSLKPLCNYRRPMSPASRMQRTLSAYLLKERLN
jgi:hypothetical protein